MNQVMLWNVCRNIGISVNHIIIQNLYTGQKATLRTKHDKTARSSFEKELRLSGTFSFYLFKSICRHIFWGKGGLVKIKHGFNTGGIYINNSHYADDTILITENNLQAPVIIVKNIMKNRTLYLI